MTKTKKTVKKAVFPVRRNAPAVPRSSGPIEGVVREALTIMQALENVKPLYGRLDELTLALRNVRLDNYGLAIVDNYAEKNTVFRTTSVKRFELKRIS